MDPTPGNGNGENHALRMQAAALTQAFWIRLPDSQPSDLTFCRQDKSLVVCSVSPDADFVTYSNGCEETQRADWRLSVFHVIMMVPATSGGS